jgi:hypothetical protein
MAWRLVRRRGTAAEHATFTGAEGEFTYDLTNKRIIAHDGVTTGGWPAARLSDFAAPPALGDTAPNSVAATTLSASGATALDGDLSVSGTVSGAGFTARFASPGPIGSVSASAGAFTDLSSSGVVSGAGFSNYLASPPAIGGVAPAAGSFTTLSASGSATFTGAVSVLDANLSIKDIADQTKVAQLECSGIAAGTTRMLTVPNASGTIALTSDIAALSSVYQPLDADLTAIAGLTSAADRVPYFTGSGTAALATFTAAGRALVDDVDAAAQRATLGLVIGTDVQAQNARLQDIASNLSGASGAVEKTGANTFGVYTVTAAGKAILDDADASAQRTTLGLGSIATQAASAIAITGGTVDGAAIGGVTPAAGAFTTLSATGAASFTSTFTGGDNTGTFTAALGAGATAAAATKTVNVGTGAVDGASTTAVTIGATGGTSRILLNGLQNFADDAAAAGGGISIGQLYRNGSVVMIRVA